MPRAIWSGAISFGLVNIPVKLYSAVSRKTVRFHQIDAESGQRIRQQRVNPASGDEVPYEQIVKGYELLLDAMREADKVAIARVVIRSKENLVALRSYDGAITMETMLFPDEVVQPESIEELSAIDGDVKTTKRELDMAKQLIESLSADFDPSGYRDEYRERVLDMIERKAAGETITVEAPEPERKEVPDLMAALEASISASKSPPKKRARSANGSGASKKKKTAAKK
jgi:DNA end-binding protein Ku